MRGGRIKREECTKVTNTHITYFMSPHLFLGPLGPLAVALYVCMKLLIYGIVKLEINSTEAQ